MEKISRGSMERIVRGCMFRGDLNREKKKRNGVVVMQMTWIMMMMMMVMVMVKCDQ